MSTVYRSAVAAGTYITSVKLCLGKASGLSILLPMTSNGIPVKDGLLRRSWSSPFAIAIFSQSAASTTYLHKHVFNIKYNPSEKYISSFKEGSC
jgi:type III secretory pathway component EscT